MKPITVTWFIVLAGLLFVDFLFIHQKLSQPPHSWMGAAIDRKQQAIVITCMDGKMPNTERTTVNSFIVSCSE